MGIVNEETGKKIEIINSKNVKWEVVSFWLLTALAFLLPIFVLPFVVSSVASSKAVLLYFGVLISAFFWLLAAQGGQVKIPKSALLVWLVAIVLVWWFASFFSDNSAVSFVGKVYDLDTFSIIGFASLLLFLTSVLFQSEKRIFTLYFLLFISSLFLFLFQFLHMIFGINIIPVRIFQSVISNPAGSWNDFAIFFGFIGLTSMAFFELFKLERWMKFILLILLIFSVLAMAVVNLFINWIIFGFFVLLLFVFLLYQLSSLPNQKENKTYLKKFLIIPLSVVLISAFFVYDHVRAEKNKDNGIGGKISAALNATTFTVRPPLSATWNVTKQTMKSDPLLGSGPNTFLYDWLKFKPAEINKTIFWDVRFSSGIGYLSSALATTGLLGGFVLLGFFSFFLFYGAKIMSGGQKDPSEKLMTVSFLGAAYLWVFVIFYTPGLAIIAMAFMMTGLLVAAMARAGKVKTIELSFLNNTKTKFFSILVVILLFIGLVLLAYSYSRKFLALRYYGEALKTFNAKGDTDMTAEKLTRAIKMDRQDEYFRALSEVHLIKMSQIITDGNLPKETSIALFRDNLTAAVGNAQEAIKLNPLDPENKMQLGRVYEFVVPLNMTDADKEAIKTYDEALALSPSDPSPLLASARVRVNAKRTKEARDYIKSALTVKPDFAPALFLLAQIEAQDGNLKEAIVNTERAALLLPNDIGVFFQLGLLYYQDNNLNFARLAFEKVVGLNPSYANARYFLGLIYDRQGEKDMVIEQFENILKTNAGNEEVVKILDNLRSGRGALIGISPPEKSPEKRKNPPVSEEKTELESD